MACHFSSGGKRRRVCGVFSSGLLASFWSLWAAFFGWASLGWAGWSRGFLSAGAVGVAFGVAWLGGCRLGGVGVRLRCCATVPPVFPLSRWLAGVHSWEGGFSPLLWFFLCGGGCLFLPLPSLGWCTHLSANGVPNWVAVGVVVGRGPCSGPVPLVVYVVAWAAGPSCRARLWFCRLGGCASRCHQVIGQGVGVVRVPPPLQCQVGGSGFYFPVAVSAGGPRLAGRGSCTDGRVVASTPCVVGWCGVVPRLLKCFFPLRSVRRLFRATATVSVSCLGAAVCSGVYRAVLCCALPCCAALFWALLRCALC